MQRHATLDQRWANNCVHTANTRRRPNAGLMLAHRLRRWANISPALGQRLVLLGILGGGGCLLVRVLYSCAHTTPLCVHSAPLCGSTVRFVRLLPLSITLTLTRLLQISGLFAPSAEMSLPISIWSSSQSVLCEISNKHIPAIQTSSGGGSRESPMIRRSLWISCGGFIGNPNILND